MNFGIWHGAVRDTEQRKQWFYAIFDLSHGCARLRNKKHSFYVERNTSRIICAAVPTVIKTVGTAALCVALCCSGFAERFVIIFIVNTFVDMIADITVMSGGGH